LAALAVYAFYLFFPGISPRALSNASGMAPAALLLRRLLMPPLLYLGGVAFVPHLRKPSDLPSRQGIPRRLVYFPVVFVLKSPLGFLALLALAAPRRLATSGASNWQSQPFHWNSRRTGVLCGSP